MTLDANTLRAFAYLKNEEVHQYLINRYAELAGVQQVLRDEVEFRWNQGKQQLIAELLDIIDGARDSVESAERKEASSGHQPPHHKSLKF